MINQGLDYFSNVDLESELSALLSLTLYLSLLPIPVPLFLSPVPVTLLSLCPYAYSLKSPLHKPLC